MNLFNQTINGWDSWEKVFQSIEAFEPLVRRIYEQEKLPFDKIENLTPGTNAVFKAGNTVVKVFAPCESGLDTRSDFDAEMFGMQRASELGIATPKLVASGFVNDKYKFMYIISEYINGKNFDDIKKDLSYTDKEQIGKKLRQITDKLNTPCKKFNDIDIIGRAIANERWRAMPESFNRERVEYLKRIKIGEKVYVHGDLHGENIILDKNKDIYIIDFADALLAPKEYEYVALFALFDFSYPYMIGYYGKDYDVKEVSKKYLEFFLLHDFAFGIIEDYKSPNKIKSLRNLQKLIYKAIKKGKSKY